VIARVLIASVLVLLVCACGSSGDDTRKMLVIERSGS